MFEKADKERLRVALSVLKITWWGEEGNDEDEEYEDDEFEPHAVSNN